jgi:hypothetical protein
MGVVALIARAELRQRWRSLAFLGLLGGIVGAVVLGALIGARRTGTAFDRLVDSTSFWDAEVIAEDAEVAKAVELDEVDTTWPLSVKVGAVQDSEEVILLGLFAGPERPAHHYEPIVVEGRLPTAVDELVVSELTAKQFGRGVGDHLVWKGLSPAQFDRLNEEGSSPGEAEGPQVDFTIVGVIRDANDALSFELAFFLTSPAFHEEVAADVGGFDLMTVHLDRGAADIERFRSDVEAIGNAGISSIHDKRPTVDSAASVAVRALVAFAAAAFVAGVVALGQATSRTLIHAADDLETERSLGISRRHRLLALVVPFGATIAVAVPLTVVGAVVLSASTGGVGQGLEPHPGVAVNVAALAAGALGIALLVALVVGVTAAMHLRRKPAGPPTRSSAVVSRVAALGAPPAVIAGTRFAFEPGRGTGAVPTRSTILAAVVGVSGLVGALCVLASLDRTTSTPSRYGWTLDASVGGSGQSTVGPAEGAAQLAKDTRFSTVLLLSFDDTTLNGQPASIVGLDVISGSASRTLLAGRLPSSPTEIALGPKQADALDVGIGDVVEAPTDDGSTVDLRVTGLVLTEGPADYANRAVLTPEGFDSVAANGEGDTSSTPYVSVADGVDRDALLGELAAEYEVHTAEPPAEITNLGQARGLIQLLAAFLALLGVIAVVHALTLIVRRRNRDLAVLRSLGMTGRQLRGSLRATSAVLTGAGLVIGAPLGVLVATIVWRQLAGGVHVADDVSVPVVLIGGIILTATVLSLVLGALPGMRATRLPAATTLRTE